MNLLTALLSLYGMGQEAKAAEVPDLTQLLPALTATSTNPMYGDSSHPQWGQLINKYSAEQGLNPKFVESVMLAESQGNPRAFSPVGAKGLMQIMGPTGEYLGAKDLWNPEENIKAGTKYLRQIADQVGDSPEHVAAGYNWGPGRAKKFAGMPYSQWEGNIPEETRNYIKKIKKGLGM